ncbi:MAG: hypothetical protein PVJ71_04635 [Lysobacterales bacterium]|jgi:hypothetical protein
MTDQAFVRQRRCLNITSLVLIVYFLTGVQFAPHGFSEGHPVFTIEYEIIAMALVWIAFFYFWWRFHLFGEDVRRQWKLDYLFQLSKNQKYRRLYEQPEGEGEGPAGQTVWAPALHGEGFRRYLSWEEAYLVGVRTEGGELQFAAQETFNESISPASQRWDVGPDTVIPLKWHRYALPALKANVAAMTNKSGTEWALPNFLACIALLCGIEALVATIV